MSPGRLRKHEPGRSESGPQHRIRKSRFWPGRNAPSCALIIPTRNAGRCLDRLLPALAAQTMQPDELLVVDSQSSDDTVARFRAFGARVEIIAASRFNHGGTRRWASEQTDADILIMMTQDAIPADPDSLRRLYDAIVSDPEAGLAYGRQLPHPQAGLLGAHARVFNYPGVSLRKRLADAARLGIKTCFASNSFAAVRRSALLAVGGFPKDVISGEDVHVAGRMLLDGWAVSYAAEARAYHSHDYSPLEEFRRYFDCGVFYGRERWIRERFGSARGEGWRFVLSELRAAHRAGALWRCPEILLRSALKLAGYKLGQLERFLPRPVKRRIGSFRGYWA